MEPKSFLGVAVRTLFGRPSFRAKVILGTMYWASQSGHPRIVSMCSRLLEKYSVYISKYASVGEGLNLPHPVAIVIGAGVSVGRNVTIYQSVTLGGRVKGDWEAGNYPTISDGCILFAGAVVAGNVRIGKNSVIGANSVVLSDVPDNSVAVGAPARIVKTDNLT